MQTEFVSPSTLHGGGGPRALNSELTVKGSYSEFIVNGAWFHHIHCIRAPFAVHSLSTEVCFIIHTVYRYVMYVCLNSELTVNRE